MRCFSVTDYCYSEVFRSSRQSCSVRTTFQQDTFRRLLSFHKKILKIYRMSDKRKHKKDSYTEKKAKHGTEGNVFSFSALILSMILFDFIISE